MTRPNFLIIGAAKAGTTSICHYLNQHPQIYISPVKEPRFFAPEFYTTQANGLLRDEARTSVMSLTEYKNLFAGVNYEVAAGEASTEYLYFPQTPQRIADLIPDIKIIAILRQPAERAFSAFCYQVRDGCENLTFEAALEEELARANKGWRPGWLYQASGFYYQQLKRYFAVFEPEQIKIYLYDELRADSLKVMQNMYRFLDVDDKFVPKLTKRNVSKMPKNKWLNFLMKRQNPLKSTAQKIVPPTVQTAIASKIKQHNIAEKPVMTKQTKKQLIELYRSDINNLEKLIQRDLSHWLN